MASVVIGFRFQNGVFFNGEVSAEDYEKLKSEERFQCAEDIARQTASNYCLQLDPLSSLAEIRLREGGFEGCTEGVEYHSMHDLPGENVVESQWSDEAVHQMLQVYQLKRSLFHSSQYKKIDVWKMIAADLRKLGHYFTFDQCNKKMVGLRKRYRLIKDSCTESRKKWVHFHMMDHFENGGTLALQNAEAPEEAGSETDNGIIIQALNQGDGIYSVDLGPDMGVIHINFQNENAEQVPVMVTTTDRKPESEVCIKAEPSDQPVLDQPSSDLGDTVFFPREQTSWSSAAVLDLIEVFKEHRSEFASTKRRRMWQKVAAAMKERGHSFTNVKCYHKIEGLRAAYLRLTEGKSRYGDNWAEWEYFEPLRDVWAGELPTEPPNPPKKKQPAVNNEEGSGESQQRYWGHSEVKQLLRLYLQHKPLFLNGSTRPQSVWKLISNKLLELGHRQEPERCEKKMRNLMYRYNTIINSKGLQKRLKCQWEHFEMMQKIMSEDDPEDAMSATNYNGVTQTQGEQSGSVNSVNNMDQEELDARPVQSVQGRPIWMPKEVSLLLNICIDNKQLFTSPGRGGKWRVWRLISNKLANYGAHFSASQCDKKYRNLLCRYRSLKTLGSKACLKWRHYSLMDKLMRAFDGDDVTAEIEPPASPPAVPDFPDAATDPKPEPAVVQQAATTTSHPTHIVLQEATHNSNPLLHPAPTAHNCHCRSNNPPRQSSTRQRRRPRRYDNSDSDAEWSPRRKRRRGVRGEGWEPPRWFEDFAQQQVQVLEEIGGMVREHSDVLKRVADLLAKSGPKKQS